MDYTIKSGRATFNVAGEFEVDLTIADEDPDTQFWFIDFRFQFSPSLSEVPPHVRAHIESRVNETLMKDGLTGCYKLLHGMVLTHKISEFRRQAAELARGKWIDGLKVEALNRALCIQYWSGKYGPKGFKSWIILGVHSGKRKVGRPHPGDTSRLFLRWFRDSKEVKDVDIPFDAVDISAESLLKATISKHVNHILTSMYEKLRTTPLYASQEAVISLSTSPTEPAESELKVQLTSNRHLSVRIEPITGRFILSPSSRLNIDSEFKLNEQCPDPAEKAHKIIEDLRAKSAMDEITFRSLSLGWNRVGNPGIKVDDLRSVVPKDTMQVLWLQRPGWVKNWYIAVSMSVSAERWWLIETYVMLLSTFSVDANPFIVPDPRQISTQHPSAETRSKTLLLRSKAPFRYPSRTFCPVLIMRPWPTFMFTPLALSLTTPISKLCTDDAHATNYMRTITHHHQSNSPRCIYNFRSLFRLFAKIRNLPPEL